MIGNPTAEEALLAIRKLIHDDRHRPPRGYSNMETARDQLIELVEAIEDVLDEAL